MPTHHVIAALGALGDDWERDLAPPLRFSKEGKLQVRCVVYVDGHFKSVDWFDVPTMKEGDDHAETA